MTEAQWLACDDPAALLEALRASDKTTERRLRLFACACVGRLWRLLIDDSSRNAVEVAERYADGLASEEELDIARDNIRYDPDDYFGTVWCLALPRSAFTRPTVLRRYGVVDCDGEPERLERICSSGCGYPIEAASAVCRRVTARIGETAARVQAALLRDIFPFRAAPFAATPPALLGGTAVRLAQAIYEERAFDRLPILADALEESGCHDERILGHCRGGGEHVRGCFALDLLLGKE